MQPARSLAAALAEGTVVLDGGLSNQLEAQGCDLSDDLWSARLLADDPHQIEAAHAAYVRAGAQVLITASYQATFEGFARRGVRGPEAARLFARSVQRARAAAESTRNEVWVAASVGPYGAMLADGSEYRGRYGLSVRELERFHRPRVEALAEAGPMSSPWRRCRTSTRPRRCCARSTAAGFPCGCRTACRVTGHGPASRWQPPVNRPPGTTR